MMDIAQRLISTLPGEGPGLFNPWRDHCPHDAAGNGPAARLERLSRHLDCDPAFILCGEAPGYRGCRTSGIAFTSERLLVEGAIPRVPAQPRLSDRALPLSEPSATIVWRTLYRLRLENQVILWNALQLHPHRPGEIWSNRTPTDSEIALGEPALRILVEAFPAAKLVAIGKKAEGLLLGMGLTLAGSVRHPANGGATEFAAGMARIGQSHREPTCGQSLDVGATP